VAHDINNAFAPILMGIELLRMENPDSTEMLDTMEASARRGAGMVRQVLTFAKGAEGERLLVQPRHLLGKMEKIIHGTFPKNIEFRTG
jgi:two-component system, cell cycle sensor histidine kinase and response regulator CckA